MGINDLNPTRVLLDCENLFITLGARGLISEWLRLPTMGQKIIHCTLHKHSVGGLTLALFIEPFGAIIATNVQIDRLVRIPGDIRQSGAENKRHKEYMVTFRGPMGPKLQPPPLPPEIQSQLK
jgi:hypothetical protein